MKRDRAALVAHRRRCRRGQQSLPRGGRVGPDDLRISFDPEGDAPYCTVDHIVVHPDWFTAPPCIGNSKQRCLAPLAEDIALVVLDNAVAGVTPAPIAGMPNTSPNSI